MMTVVITLTTIGEDTGPNFDLFSDTDGFVAAFGVDVPGALLLGGYTATNVPDGTTVIRVKSHDNIVCTNYIDITVVSNLTTTTTSSSSTTTTTAVVPDTELFFASIGGGNQGIMGINNGVGQSFYITFSYYIHAFVDNSANTASANTAESYFEISVDGGLNWGTIVTVQAHVDGGVLRTDSNSSSGLTSIGGITDIADVMVRINMDCGVDDIGVRTGGGTVSLASVLPSYGSAVIICNDRYNAECSIEFSQSFNLDCVTP